MLRVSSRAADSSVEASVMGVERWVALSGKRHGPTWNEDETVTNPKPYDIPKRRVLEAYRRVKANQGAAGIDGESLKMFEADLSRNLYKLWNRLASGQPATPVVCSLARPWESRGTDNGSCMTGDCHVQFCEGLWVKLPRSTL
jgi:RNA-directed DNA polymerase